MGLWGLGLTHISQLSHVLLKFYRSGELQRVDGPVSVVHVRDVAVGTFPAGIPGVVG